MKHLFVGALTLIALTGLTHAANAKVNRTATTHFSKQARTTCYMAATEESIPVGRRYPVGRNGPESAYLKGNQPGSQVNVRTGPGTNYDVSGYGLVGEDVSAIDMALDSNCDVWLRVNFPASNHEGWVHSTYFSFYAGRGYFD